MTSYFVIFSLEGELDERLLISKDKNQFEFSPKRAYHLVRNNCFVIEKFNVRVWQGVSAMSYPNFEADRVFGWNMEYLYHEMVESQTRENIDELRKLNEGLKIEYSGLYHQFRPVDSLENFIDPRFQRELIERLLA